jgi:hypothetical protein
MLKIYLFYDNSELKSIHFYAHHYIKVLGSFPQSLSSGTPFISVND